LALKKCGVPRLVVFLTTLHAKERRMNYSIHLLLTLATVGSQSDQESSEGQDRGSDLDSILAENDAKLRELLARFMSNPVTPAATLEFEQALQQFFRETSRQVVQCIYNGLESAPAELPKQVRYQGQSYTRLNRKTPQNAWTLFGQIRLGRVGYRDSDKGGEPSIFPLALALGLVQGATPALAERAAAFNAEGGATQQRVLQRLRRECGVGWGIKKWRALSAAISAEFERHQHDAQVEQLLQWLRRAEESTGRHKPALWVGRDGITLGLRYKKGCLFEVATTGTVSVINRRGQRLGTVYLAYVPELGQQTMSAALTRLVREVLQRWEGPLPRLAYVSDAGNSEAGYYRKELAKMIHPRTGAALDWLRIVDYYHASQRVWRMAKILFGDTGKAGQSWARKMLRWMLRKSRGVNRVLHSAAALLMGKSLTEKKRKKFAQAYRYLRKRMKYMRYDEYKRLGLPRGSGVTEAACKTVFSQRLKLSGMRWKKPGAATILVLRVIHLSGVWDEVYRRVLESRPQAQLPSASYPKTGTQERVPPETAKIAA
jgi:hypothetical protein